MENNKYFTPDIEDLHIGYECEIYAQNTDKLIRKVSWHTVTVHFSPMMSKHVGLNQVPRLSKTKHIRVPYLTKEQIEAEGWKHYGKNCFELNPRWFCSWYPEKNRLDIYDEENDKNFAGECKDINTFRKICKLLGI